MQDSQSVTLTQAQAFLAERFGTDPATVELAGEGAWSRCYAFRHNGESRVIKFGRHLDDFLRDKRACAYASPALPVPRVYEIGEAFGMHYAIADRAHGEPLENVPPEQWPALAPAAAAMLEALRTADVSGTTGWGTWGADGNGENADWRSFLLGCNIDDPAQRTYGWKAKLSETRIGTDAYAWGYDLMGRLARNDVPRCLIHSDLMNRNALAQGARITGVFDWGCANFGDHLYELAWFEFWAPWHPNLDVPYLRAQLEQRWRAAGYWPDGYVARLLACHLHIGLTHLSYNAFTGRMELVEQTANRMRELAAWSPLSSRIATHALG